MTVGRSLARAAPSRAGARKRGSVQGSARRLVRKGTSRAEGPAQLVVRNGNDPS